MSESEGIILAHQPPFRLGALSIRPALREVVHDDGRREVLEPRVMQVLTVMALAKGEIVTRDDLTRLCWGGRVVGEDSISRVTSRLHRLSKGIAAGSFRIDTVVKVGYRLLQPPLESTIVAALAPPTLVEARQRLREDPRAARRRVLVLGASAAGLAAFAGAGAWSVSAAKHQPSAAVLKLYAQGWVALRNILPEQVSQAIGLFTRVVESDPEFADGWGSLAYAYAEQATSAPASVRQGARERASAAAERAFKLEKANAFAQAAQVELQPVFGNWAAAEKGYRTALARRPRTSPLLYHLSHVLSAVGRNREAAATLDQKDIDSAEPMPFEIQRRTMSYLNGGRVQEADRLSAHAVTLYPRNLAIWFTRFHLLVRTGRPDLAIAQAAVMAERPTGIPEHEFDAIIAGARAVMTRTPADIEQALAINVELAHRGAGYAENTIALAASLGRPDVAFGLLDVQFSPQRKEIAFSQQEAVYYPEPRTEFLFGPAMASLFSEPRFAALVTRIGLTECWRTMGKSPDYQSLKS